MTRVLLDGSLRFTLAVGGLLLWMGAQTLAQTPNPVLNTIYPAGGRTEVP